MDSSRAANGRDMDQVGGSDAAMGDDDKQEPSGTPGREYLARNIQFEDCNILMGEDASYVESDDGRANDSSSNSENTSASPAQSPSETRAACSTAPTSNVKVSSSQSDIHKHENGFQQSLPDAKPTVLDAFEDDNDIQSVASISDSIGSTDSRDDSLGQAGVNYIVAKLTGDADLLAMYTDASMKLSQARFVANNRRLMKGLYLDMSREPVQSASKKEVSAFLRSRRIRHDISLDVYRTIIPDDEGDILARPHENEFPMLAKYLRERDAAGQPNHLLSAQVMLMLTENG